MQTRMSTNAILNTRDYINKKQNKKSVDANKALTGLLSRDTMKVENEDPLPVKLVMDIKKAFGNV